VGRAKLKQMKLGADEKLILAVMPNAGLLKMDTTIHTKVFDTELLRFKWNKETKMKEEDVMYRLNFQKD
jgi:hypothetical protein